MKRKVQTITVLPRDPNVTLVTLHTLRQKFKNDSMHYFGQHIATVTKNKRKLIVESAGEMKAYFEENGDCFQNEDLRTEMYKRGTTDRQLSALGRNDMIGLNNWFRIMDDATGEEIGIAHTFDDSISFAKQLIEK